MRVLLKRMRVLLKRMQKDRNVLLGFISCQKFEKNTKKNATFFLGTQHSFWVRLGRKKEHFSSFLTLKKNAKRTLRSFLGLKKNACSFERMRVLLKRTSILFKERTFF